MQRILLGVGVAAALGTAFYRHRLFLRERLRGKGGRHDDRRSVKKRRNIKARPNGKKHPAAVRVKVDPSGTPLDIVVVGAGISGLATALALQRAGMRVRVYERDGSFEERKQGYGMTLRETKAIQQLGLSEEFRLLDVPSRSHYVFDDEGHILGYFGNEFHDRPVGLRGNLRIPRQELRKLLQNRLKPGTIYWGYKCAGFEERRAGSPGDSKEEGKVIVRFEKCRQEDGESPSRETEIDADILVAADGIRSRIRTLDLGDPLEYLGVVVILGLSTLVHPLIRERGFHTVDGKRRRLFTMPYSNTLTMWQLTVRMPEATARKICLKDSESLLHFAQTSIESWHEPCQDLLKQSVRSETWGTPLYDRKALAKREKKTVNGKRMEWSRVTYVGDAAHPMSPFKGQGANQALQDGPHLTRWILKCSKGIKGNESGIRTALKCYEREMITRSSPKVKASREAAAFFHSPSVLRDAGGIAGVSDIELPGLLHVLREKGIMASKGSNIDSHVKAALGEYRESKWRWRSIFSS